MDRLFQIQMMQKKRLNTLTLILFYKQNPSKGFIKNRHNKIKEH